MNTGTAKPQLYSILNGDNFSYNALPIESVQALPIGVYSNTAGECTFSVDASQAPGISQLLLTDNSSGLSTDLLTSDYHFTATAGTNTTRFTISAQRIATQTNLVNTNSVSPSVLTTKGKLLLDGISGTTFVKIFDARGSLIISLEATKKLEIPLPASGVYSVQLKSGSKAWVQKVVYLN